MKFRVTKIPLKIVKYTGISLLSILAIMFLMPYLFPGFVSDKIKKWANNSIEAELNFSKARLSFFNHFPSLTLTLYDVNLKGSEPFKKDTLVAAKEIALGVDLSSIFNKALRIGEIYVTNGKINVLVNKEGFPNYNIYKTKPSNTATDTAVSDAALKLEHIQIEDCALVYDDQSIPIKIKTSKLNYAGKGDLSKAIFDLTSKIKMEGLDLSYGGEQYLSNKALDAKLITRINTNSLELDFQRNNLKINELPVDFTGKFNFLKNGYSMDFSATTKRTKFKNLFTALPPAFVTWVDKTNVKGNISLDASLKGNFIASEGTAPNILFNVNVEDGSLTAANITQPIDNIFLKLQFALPNLNTENMTVKIDTLNAIMGKDYIRGVLQTSGLSKPFLKGYINAAADVEKWGNVLALDSIGKIQMKGLLQLQANFNGTYNPAAKQFPVTKAAVQWKNGYLKTGYYPNAITNIDAAILNNQGTTKDLKVNIKPISLQFEGQPFTIAANLNNFDNLVYNISSKGTLNIGKIYQLFAIKGYNVNGLIKTDLTLIGSQEDAMASRYNKLSNKGTITVKALNISTPYFPQKFNVQSGDFRFNNDKIETDNFVLNYASNTVSLKGEFPNIIDYALKENAPLKGKLSLTSKLILIHELMSFTTDSSVTKTSKVKNTPPPTEGVVMIPPNLDLQFNAQIDKVNYNDLAINNCVSNAAIQNGKLTISKAAFTVIDAPVNMEATYAPVNIKRAYFNYHITAKEIDIQKAYKNIKLFREMATSASKVKGQVAIDYTLNGLLNDSLYPIFPTLKGGGTLSNAKIFGLKMLSVKKQEKKV
jgi:AsmA protein